MPFKSVKQEKWMWANKPEMAREWEKHTKESEAMSRVLNKKRKLLKKKK